MSKKKNDVGKETIKDNLRKVQPPSREELNALSAQGNEVCESAEKRFHAVRSVTKEELNFLLL